jgi:hypothetical protein
MFLFGAVQEYPIFDQNRDSFNTERTRNGLQKIRNKLPIQKIKHFVLLCNEPRVSQFRAMKETNMKN